MSQLIKVNILVQLILMFIIPSSDSYFSIAVLSFFSVGSLVSLYYLFMFYFLLQDNKQTILVYLTRLLIVSHTILILHHIPIEIMMHCFKKFLIAYIKETIVSDNLGLVYQRLNPGVMWMITMIEIIVFKTLLRIAPVTYLGMNTKTVKFICAFISMIMFLIQCIFTNSYSDSLFYYLEYHSIQIPEIKPKKSGSSKNEILAWVFVLAIILILLEIYGSFLHDKLMKSIRFAKTKTPFINQVYPTSTQESIEHVEDGHIVDNPVDTADKDNVSTDVFAPPENDKDLNLGGEGNADTGDQDGQDDGNPKKLRPLDSQTKSKADGKSLNLPITQHKLQSPVSYGFVLMMALLACCNVFILFLNIEVKGSKTINWISFTLFKFEIYNSPMIWILSHPNAKKFALNRLKQNAMNLPFISNLN